MKRIIYFAALVALLAGCSKITQSETPLRDTPISVNVLMPEILTRAGYDSNNLPTKFYLSINQNGDKYDYTNVVMKLEEGKWVAYESDAENAPKKLLLWEGSVNQEGSANPVIVTAATFPLAGGAPYTVSVSDDQSIDEKLTASDHLWYYNESISPFTHKDGISIEFCHLMSKVKIEIKLKDEYAGINEPVTSVAVLNTKTQAHYAPKNDSGNLFGNHSNPASILACKTGYNSGTRTATFEVILVPQTVAAGSFGLSILVGNNTYEWFSTAEVKFASNTIYTLSLTADKDASTRTLTLANEEVYNKWVANVSTDEKTWITGYWKNGAEGANIILLDGSTLD